MNKPEEMAQMLAGAPRSSWIALSEDSSRIVGVGNTMKEAVSKAAENGVEDPVLTMTPQKWTSMVLLVA
jgi:hypothetical protein